MLWQLWLTSRTAEDGRKLRDAPRLSGSLVSDIDIWYQRNQRGGIL